MDKSKIIKMLVLLAVITIAAGSLLRMLQRNSISLAEYEKLNGSGQETGTDADAQNSEAGSDDGGTNGETESDDNGTKGEAGSDDNGTKGESESDDNGTKGEAGSDDNGTNGETGSAAAGQEPPSEKENPQDPAETLPPSLLTGAVLNGNSQMEERFTYEEGFYYEPLSDNLRRYVTGISYPGSQIPENAAAPDADAAEAEAAPKITLEELRYVHILHYDFDGNPTEGELICNEYIARDLVEIFYELYRSEYRLEKVLLIDEYNGDDIASMEDNNTSCFNYRVVAGSSSLSRHAYGLAVDVNPLYNPYITYNKDGTSNVSPSSGESYADRTLNFPYKIDEEDLCYKLFIQHGFTWGGSWNHSKDYQHFQKTKP